VRVKFRAWDDVRVTWTAPDIDPKGGSTVAPERELLEGYLDWQRESFLAKCAGLTGEQLATRAAAPSNLSLLGLIRHFTKVERVWFRQRVAQQDVEPLFGWGTERRDEDFDDLDPARAQTEYDALVAEMRLAREAAAGFTLDEVFDSGRNGLYSLRMIYVHMIGEYAQHNGHADIVREHLDGITTT
jgi:hypothetical protein